jgi:hypothetical protein
MEPIATLENVSGDFKLENIEVSGETPYLLQATSGGVNYNQQVNFGRGYEVEASFTVYDVTKEWKDVSIGTARYVLRREHDRLRVDKLFVIENETEPKKTLYDPDGTFRFHLPSDMVELYSVTASSGGGMPVPQSASPLPDGSAFITRTAFKPGNTDFAISYEVDYSGDSYTLEEETFFPLSQLMLVVAPTDIELEAEGWEDLGPEPGDRFVVLRRTDVGPGTPLAVKLKGGSEHASELGTESASDAGGSSSGQSSGSITLLPDTTRSQKWIIVILMGAALAYGLLAALVPAIPTGPPDPKIDGLRQAIAQLESRRSSGKVSAKRYRKEKKELEARLRKAIGKG